MRSTLKILFFSMALGVLSGCKSLSPESPAQPLSSPPPVLETATGIAVKNTLDMRVLESLQRIAREHVEKRRLLELPGMIYDLPRRLPQLNVENDYRLQTLFSAVEACHILTSPAQTDLSQLQSKSEKRKIAMEQAILWSKLDYVNRLKKLGITNADIKNMERDMTLELSIASGIPADAIARFDFNSLPQPYKLPPIQEPAYIKKILQSYNEAPDTALRFADIVYRLPTELLQRKGCDFRNAFELVYSAGGVIHHRILDSWAEEAFKQFMAAEKHLKSTPVKMPQLYIDMESARLRWRIAFFKKQSYPLKFPAKPDPNEIIFLTDLISLQGK